MIVYKTLKHIQCINLFSTDQQWYNGQEVGRNQCVEESEPIGDVCGHEDGPDTGTN
jgi:hypothetical protein